MNNLLPFDFRITPENGSPRPSGSTRWSVDYYMSNREMLLLFQRRIREQGLRLAIWMYISISSAAGDGTFEDILTVDKQGKGTLESWFGGLRTEHNRRDIPVTFDLVDLIRLEQVLFEIEVPYRPGAVKIPGPGKMRPREVLVYADEVVFRFYFEPGEQPRCWFARHHIENVYDALLTIHYAGTR